MDKNEDFNNQVFNAVGKVPLEIHVVHVSYRLRRLPTLKFVRCYGLLEDFQHGGNPYIIQIGTIKLSLSKALNCSAMQRTAPVPSWREDLSMTPKTRVRRLSGVAVFLISRGHSLPSPSKMMSISLASRSR